VRQEVLVLSLQFGHLKAGFHFVPEGRAIVARRFIAGLTINITCVPEGRLNSERGRQKQSKKICTGGRKDNKEQLGGGFGESLVL
jgi:hypothetical protein